MKVEKSKRNFPGYYLEYGCLAAIFIIIVQKRILDSISIMTTNTKRPSGLF